LRSTVPIGYAVYFSFSYSTWLGKHGIYLKTLLSAPEQRKIGAGKGLLRHLAQSGNKQRLRSWRY
jgi:hypothetical protein